MKAKKHHQSLLAALSLAGLTLAISTVNAVTYYWDSSPGVAGFGTAGGTWSAPTDPALNTPAGVGWSTSSTGAAATVINTVTTLSTNATNDAVNFGNTTTGLAAGTITVSGTVQSGNMTFASGSGSILLSGGTINLTNAATGPTITVNSTSAASTISSNLTGGLATSIVTKAGAGTLYLSGNNSYLSRTQVSGGVLVLTSANALPAGGLNLNTGILGLGFGDFTRLSGAATPANGTFYFNNNAGFAAYGADRSVNIGGAGGNVGIGSTTFAAISSFNGKSLILGATTATHKVIFINSLDVGAATRTVQVDNGAAAVDAEIRGVIQGTAGLNKPGTGTLLLSAANTFPGPLGITAGTLMVGNPAALGASTAVTTVSNGAVLDLNGTSMTIANPLTLNGTGISSSGSLINSSATPGTFAGPVTFGNATIRIGGTGVINLSNTSAIIGTNSSLTLAGAGGSVGGALQTGAGSLTTNSTGTWSLNGTNTYTGATAINGGTLALIGTADINSSSDIAINALGAKLLQASSVALTPAVTLTQGTVTGSGTISSVSVGHNTGGIISNNNGVAGASLTIGTLAFDGAATVNTYSSSTSAPIATTTLTTNAAGMVTINASSAVWADNTSHELISYGGVSVGGAGSAQFVLGTVTGLSARQAASPTLTDTAGAIRLTITGDTPYWTGDGDDTWNLASVNNWSKVSDSSATLYLTNDNVLFNDNATGAGPFTVTIDAANVAPNSTVFNNLTKDYVLSSTGSFGITSGSLIKSGGGKLTINNANTYPNGTLVNGGTLQLGNANAIGTSTLTLNGGNLDSSVTNLVNAGNNVQLWNSDFTFVGTESLNLGTGAVTLNGNRSVTVNANNLTVGGSIGGGAVDLTKLGAGTLTLTTGSTFTGTLVATAGTLALSPTAAGALTMNNALSGTATLNVNPFAANSSNLSLVGDLSGFTGTVNVATSGGFNSKLATTGASSSFGAGTIVNIASGGTYYSTVNQTGITVNIFGTGNSESLGALRLDGGTLDSTSSVVLKANGSIGGSGSATINAPISEDGGSFALTKQGTGTMFLGGTNSYSGLTTVSAGVLVVQNPSALGTTAGGTFVADTTRVQLENLTVTGEPITLTGAGGDNLGALRAGSGTCLWTGPITINADLTRIGALDGTIMEVSGVIDDGPNDYRVRFRPRSASATVIVSGANTYTGGTSVFGGLVVMSSFNSVVGGTASSSFGAPVTAANGLIIIGIASTTNNPILSYIGAGETTDRTIQIGDNSATPAAGDNGAGTIENNGSSGPLVFNSPFFNTPTNAVTGTSPTRILTLGGTNTDANTISGSIRNNQIAGNPTAAVAITKTGAGTWRLTGANTYTGATIVSLGTLELIGGSQTSPFTVNASGSLGFTLGSPTTLTSTFNLSAGTIKITGTPTLASYDLITSSAGITGTPLLDTPITGYELKVIGNALVLQKAGYASWATTNSAGANLADDHDNDGVANGIEYFLGGPAGNTTGFTALPGVINTSGILSVTWPKGVDYAGVYSTDYVVETSATLNGVWTAETIGGGNITDSGTSVKFTFPGGPTYSGKNFARLRVTGP